MRAGFPAIIAMLRNLRMSIIQQMQLQVLCIPIFSFPRSLLHNFHDPFSLSVFCP